VTVKYMANFGPADSFTISSSQKTISYHKRAV
jgi:hypothetical protein